MAGVVPVAGQELDFSFPWHDSLIPISKDYLAVEHAAYECAAAGCETIWVVCHSDMQPVIRHRLGEWVIDPLSIGRGPLSSTGEKKIPIFYVPIHPKDRYKKDCLGYSALYGALTAYHISSGLSKWVIPDKYYVSFPYGAYQLEEVIAGRKKFSSAKNYLLTCQGRSVKNNHYLGFTFGAEDFKRCRDIIKKESTALLDRHGRRLPIEKRYSAQHFLLDKVFEGAIIDGEIEVPWYHSVDSWDNYKTYLSSQHSDLITRPEKMTYGEWNPIGHDGEEV